MSSAGVYTLHAGSGGAVRQKSELAAVLGLAPERLRVLSSDVGGNFGTPQSRLMSNSPWCCGRRASSSGR